MNPTLSATSRSPFGLFQANPSRQRSVPLPLKAVDVRFEVVADCAEVRIEQIYEFSGPNPVDVLYSFPLPSDASIHQCEMQIGERIVQAVARPLEEARQEYKQAHKAGKRAALLEGVRENLFELLLGNVQPGDEIHLKIAYVQALCGEGRQRRLIIPTCPGVRYIPGVPQYADGGTDLVPDAARLLPPRIRPEDEDAAVFYCAGTVTGAQQLDSETHDLSLGAPRPDGRTALTLRHDSETPDRDFHLHWQSTETAAALCATDPTDHLLCSVHVPEDLPTARKGRDLFFLLDSSGSMAGENWISVLAAMELVRQEWDAADRIRIDLFANKLQPLTGALLQPSDREWDGLLDQLRRHRPSGGTEFTSAFRQTIHNASSGERAVVIVLTDGNFGDEQEAVRLAAECNVEVHTIGIDSSVNEAVLRKMARRTRGTCTLCPPGADWIDAIRSLLENVLSPRLESISAPVPWIPVGNPPALRRGQSALVPFRTGKALSLADQAASVVLELLFSDGSRRQMEVPVLQTRSQAPAHITAKAEIEALLDEDEAEQAVKLACRHNLLCPGVAYLAIDHEESVVVSQATFHQPSLQPQNGPPDILQEAVSHYDQSEGTLQSMTLAREDGGAPQMMGFMTFSQSPTFSAEPTVRKASVPPAEITLSPEDRRKAESLAIMRGHPEWLSLLEKHLVPWASRSGQNLHRLLQLIKRLARLAESPEALPQALAAFDDLMPFLPPALEKQCIRFLSQLTRSA
jgi:Ca-activated chloride channel homolog